MNTIIIEDEAAATRRLSKLILEIAPNAKIIATLDSIEATINWFENNDHPDLIFLDIQLADGVSFEIFNHIEITKPIIFTTAYDQYAVQAFEVNAIDYILKPIKKIKLEAAINKYISRQQTPSAIDYKALAKELQHNNFHKRFMVKIGQQIKVVSIMDSAYFYTKDKITFLVTKEGKRFPIDYTLDKIEELTDKNLFFRINRQGIININAIKEMYTYSKSRVKIILNPPAEIPTVVSTERSPYFKKWLVGEYPV